MRHDRLHRPRDPVRTALVTGATGGIGEAIARALPHDASLILTGRDEGKLALLRAELGPRCTTVVADLATGAGIDAVVAAAEAGAIDLLVNNAGVGRWGAFLDEPLEQHTATLRINAEALLALTHRLVPGMLARAELGDARAGLINVASSLSFVPLPRLATYAASKAFVLSFSESLTGELAGRPIDVLCACPGAVRTGFADSAGYGAGALPGAMSPERAARAILAALGKRSTVIVGPLSSASFGGIALARSLFGRGMMHATEAFERIQRRD